MSDDDLKSVETGDTDATRTEAPGGRRSTMIGNYRILRLLGEGGMGEVYEADQEKPVRRKVALKVIKRGMDSKQIVARFESERQALALMNHPNIARVFDAGTARGGRLYFVMEFVQGVPITSYCDTHRLDMRQRLELFLQVCDGVQHAHHKGIIHRDIKPSNVLVKVEDDKPMPKIIDFGVAKATIQPLTERTMATEVGAMVGTPEYMSPEQVEMSGLDIDTRTDVYSLGLLLYELLAGAAPFDPSELRRASFDEMRRRIREEDPPAPSRRVNTLGDALTGSAEHRGTDAGSLIRQLRGDLDWIAMKSIEKDRTRRYATPSALAADISRHLRNEPVVARPPSAAYRIGKFARRHRAGVAAAVVVGAALLIGAAVSSIGFVRARAAERLARQEADRANFAAATSQEVSDFLVGLFNVSDPSAGRGNTITARELLDEGAQRIRQELRDRPRVQARLMDTIGTVYRSLGLYDESLRLLEEGLASREKALGPDHTDVAASLNNLAYLLWITGDHERARPLHERALGIREKVLGPDHPDVAMSLNNLGNVVADSGDYEASRPLYERALRIREAALGPDHTDVAASLNNLASVLQYLGRYDEARPLYERALAIDENTHGSNHVYVAIGLDNLGSLLQATGDYLDALPMHERALAIREEVLGPDHPEVATNLINIGTAFVDGGDPQAGLPYFERALAIYNKAHGPEHSDVAMALVNIAGVHRAAGDFERARPFYERSVTVFEHSLGPNHPDVATSLSGLADVLREAGDFATARSRYERALRIFEESLGAKTPRLAEPLRGLAELLRRTGQPDEASRLEARADAIGPGDPPSPS